MLNFDAPILAIAAEQMEANCQRFAILLSDRVEQINVVYQENRVQVEEVIGKSMEKPSKTMENHGKMREIDGNRWKTVEIPVASMA